MRPVICVSYYSDGQKLIIANILDRSDTPEIGSSSDRNVVLFETIALYLRIGESGLRVTLGVMDKVAVYVILETSILDKFIQYIHPPERKIVLHCSQLVFFLMVHDSES